MQVSREKSLGVLYSDLAKEWHPTKNKKLTPFHVTPGSGKKVWWKCNKGHEWRTTIASRTSGSGCQECWKKRKGKILNEVRLKKRGSLEERNPELAKEWHPTKNGKLTPHDVMMSSGKKVWWKCNKGHEWKCYIYNRTRGGQGCPYCAGKRASKEYNLAIKNPELAKEWHPTKNDNITPFDVTPASGKKVWWICDQDHEWRATVHNRKNGRGCPYCSGKRKICAQLIILIIFNKF